MDVAVRVGRAVVQDEFRPPARGGAQARPQVHLLPAGEDLRLALRQVAAHREGGLRQEHGVAVVALGGIGGGVVHGVSRRLVPLWGGRGASSGPGAQRAAGPVIRACLYTWAMGRTMGMRAGRGQGCGRHSTGQSLNSAVASDNRGNMCCPQSGKNFSTNEEERTTENLRATCRLRFARSVLSPYSVAFSASSVLKTLMPSHLHGRRDARSRVTRSYRPSAVTAQAACPCGCLYTSLQAPPGGNPHARRRQRRGPHRQL